MMTSLSKCAKHFVADLRYMADRLNNVWKKHVHGVIRELPTETPDRFQDFEVEHDVAIAMRDGVRLFADVYRPKGAGKLPTVLIRMPYGKQEPFCYLGAHGRYWALKGYACVIQDVRGKWSSEGTWDPFVNEKDDGYDTIDWIARQSWSNGKIGMTGESYYGYTQLAAAVSGHPNLTCIVPGDTAANIQGVWAYNSSVFCQQTMGIWCPETNSPTYTNFYRLDRWHLPLIEIDDDAGIPCEYYKEWIRRPLRDEYWAKINLDSFYDKIRIPVLSWGGWYDTFLKGTIDDWSGIRAAARAQGLPEHQYLLIAGTDHEVTPWFTGRIGKLAVGKRAWSYDKIQEFFDQFLMGIDTGLLNRGKVEIFITGDNKWRVEQEWPLARTQFTKFYLHSSGGAQTSRGNGTLSTTPPGEEPNDVFTYDPNHPICNSLNENLWRRADTLQDRAATEMRSDVLCYTTKKLDKELEVTGPLSATLFASSSAVDTDFTATLVDVFPDGYCHLVQEGIVRARYRDPAKGEQLLVPGMVYEFNIDMWATGHVFKPGHQIRLEISSSNFDRFNRNLNNGERIGHSREVVIAEQKVFHSVGQASFLNLPVIPR